MKSWNRNVYSHRKKNTFIPADGVGHIPQRWNPTRVTPRLVGNWNCAVGFWKLKIGFKTRYFSGAGDLNWNTSEPKMYLLRTIANKDLESKKKHQPEICKKTKVEWDHFTFFLGGGGRGQNLNSCGFGGDFGTVFLVAEGHPSGWVFDCNPHWKCRETWKSVRVERARPSKIGLVIWYS